MTIFLFHGEDHVASRNNLLSARAKHSSLQSLAGDKLDPKDLESTLFAESLFGTEPLLIENLLSRLKSKDKDACLKLLQNFAGSRDLYIWEKKALTKTVLNKLPKSWVIKESKPPAVLFNFLESLRPGNYAAATQFLQNLRESSEEGFIFIMLTRHVSTLIQVKSATNLRLPPWQLGKLKSQASHWSEPKLISLYDSLYNLDYQIKTGRTKLDLAGQLDIILVKALG